MSSDNSSEVEIAELNARINAHAERLVRYEAIFEVHGAFLWAIAGNVENPEGLLSSWIRFSSIALGNSGIHDGSGVGKIKDEQMREEVERITTALRRFAQQGDG